MDVRENTKNLWKNYYKFTDPDSIITSDHLLMIRIFQLTVSFMSKVK